MNESIRLPEGSRCPSCGYLLDAATPLKAGTKPAPGDISLCAMCGVWLVYDEKLRSRRATPAEETEIRAHPKLRLAEIVAQEFAKRRNLNQ